MNTEIPELMREFYCAPTERMAPWLMSQARNRAAYAKSRLVSGNVPIKAGAPEVELIPVSEK